VIAAGATAISIADSVSYAVPEQFGKLCEFIRTSTEENAKVTWSVHCHNEIGLAVANSLAAVTSGIRQVECTINGAGEGAGNTPLQPLIAALQKREDVFSSVTTTVNQEQLAVTGRVLAEIAGR
jgi:2-isopropylmalate synthase